MDPLNPELQSWQSTAVEGVLGMNSSNSDGLDGTQLKMSISMQFYTDLQEHLKKFTAKWILSLHDVQKVRSVTLD